MAGTWRTDGGAGLSRLVEEIRACRVCEEHLPLGPRPVVHLGLEAQVMIIGQAPGTKVHETGIPWNDPSGDRLRTWMDLDCPTFYDTDRIAIMPMGFCYPGKGKGGDLPPRPECAAKWHDRIWAQLPKIDLVLLVGRYAIERYLPQPARKATLAETVRSWNADDGKYLPLPHPSPRNTLWLKRNPWFETDTVVQLRRRLRAYGL